MFPTPRSTRAGLATQAALLLALVGVGAALFLFVLLPRLSTTRAATKGGALPPENGVEVAPAQTSAPTPVELLPVGDKDAPAEVETRPTPDDPNAAALVARATGDEPQKPRFEGPDLKHVKGGKRETYKPGELRAERREKKKQREAAEAREALATGEAPKALETQPVAPANPNLKIDKAGKGGKGAGQGRKKSPKNPPEPKGQ